MFSLMNLWCSFLLVLLPVCAEGSLVELEKQVHALRDKYNLLAAKMTAANKVVAFHAYHNSDPFSVASQGTIVYNAVGINIGNGYDSQFGIFTAPVAGTYSFFINCMAVSGTSEEPSILVNGAKIASCHSNRPDNGHPFEQGATQGIAHLNTGDRAWVRMLESARDVRGRYWNTFSGFLIRADV